MICGVAIVPSAPILLPEHTSRVDVAADLRRDAVTAVARACAGAERVVIVTATDHEPRHSKQPLGCRVATHLLALAGVAQPVDLLVIAHDCAPADCRGEGARLRAESGGRHTALVVVADGSARRSEKAPGHLDERAFAHDETTLAAIRVADPDALLAIDPGDAAALLDLGRPPLHVLAGALAGRFTSDVLRVEDPFGVRYVVATLSPCPMD